MTREEAEKYAENMTYREAIYNLMQAKSVPYRKATFIKVNELLNELIQDSTTKNDCAEQNGCISCSLDDGDCCRKLYEESMQNSTTKNDLGIDYVSRAEVKKIAKEMYLEVANMELDAKTISDCISCTSSKCREVLESKLQTLPSVTPQEPCEDAVSRQAVDGLVWQYLGKATDENIAFYEHFLDLPSVTPQPPKKGHWIEHPHECGANWEYSKYECSECHDWEEDDSDYCPNCGADMREVSE